MKRNLRAISGVLVAVLLSLTILSPVSAFAAAPSPAFDAAVATATLPNSLIPGGYPFGVKFTTLGVLVVGFRDINGAGGTTNPAKAAGLRPKDIITSINATAIESAQALADLVSASNGKPLSVTYRRGNDEQTATLAPVQDEQGVWRTGLYVRDSGAGIGTLTYIDPETLSFGGLGHGICDIDTGELMPLRRGNVVSVTVNGINRGTAGKPGEIKGYFHTDKLGSLRQNSPCGVFGVLSAIPSNVKNEAIPVASREEVRVGEAEILCTLTSGQRQSYRVTLSAIDRSATGSKCFAIQVTDPALLEQTGGIVQGMSGSPIIQNGKLVGAVTHVLISDPARGYGIFIDNMLSAAQQSQVTAA